LGGWNGILVVNKPCGPTSHDCVDVARKKSGIRRVGHAGTLDPFASGVLVLGFGKATRLLDYYMHHAKEYRMRMELGVISDTFDRTGEVLQREALDQWFPDPSAAEEIVREVAQRFSGKIQQVPPRYSAKKWKGKKMYEYARKGQDISLPPREVEVFSLRVEEVALPYVTLWATVSPGTYMRSLAMDIGVALGCGAIATDLTRTRSGEFCLEQALELPEWEKLPESAVFQSNAWIPVEKAVAFLPALRLNEEGAQKVANGNPVEASFVRDWEGSFGKKETVRILSPNGDLLALATSERTSSFLGTAISPTHPPQQRVARVFRVLA